MTTREDRDKAKSAREMLSKYFFSLSIATYTGAVMGTLASMLGLLKGIDLDFVLLEQWQYLLLAQF